MSDIIERTYRQRKHTGVKRNDIIDVCIEELEKSEHREEFKGDIEAILVANAVMLFIFGFDTQGTTTSLLFHNLIKNPDCQDRIAEEITEALNGTDGQITYEMLESLKYTDMALREAMRYLLYRHSLSYLWRSTVVQEIKLKSSQWDRGENQTVSLKKDSHHKCIEDFK